MIAIWEWNTEVYSLFISNTIHEVHPVTSPFFFKISSLVFGCQHSIKSFRDVSTFVHSPYERRISSCTVDIHLLVTRRWYHIIICCLHYRLNTKIRKENVNGLIFTFIIYFSASKQEGREVAG